MFTKKLALVLFFSAVGCEYVGPSLGTVSAGGDCGDLAFVAPCDPKFAYASARDGMGVCYKAVDQETGVASDPATGCVGTKGAVTVTCAAYCY